MHRFFYFFLVAAACRYATMLIGLILLTFQLFLIYIWSSLFYSFISITTFRYEHMASMLRDLHWLPTPERIDFKLTAHLPMPALHGLAPCTVSFRLHPARRRFQPPPCPVVVILKAGDPTNTTVHCWRSCVSGGWKPPLEQSAARRYLSINADCFPEPPQNSPLFPIISFLTVFGL